MKKQGFVYILSNRNRTTLYIGVTGNLQQRVLQHKAGVGSVFTKRYALTDLVYWEQLNGMDEAIEREKQLKRWHREWKWNLIREKNPQLIDLAADWYSGEEVEAYRVAFIGADPETSSG